MRDDERVYSVRRMLHSYVSSPSLKHIRDHNFLNQLALEIVKSLDRSYSIWKKWDGQREVLLKSALGCWVPLEDLRGFSQPNAWAAPDPNRCRSAPEGL